MDNLSSIPISIFIETIKYKIEMGTTEFIIALLSAVGISNVITFFLTKKKYITEVDSQQIKNVEDSFELYKKIMTDAIKVQDDKIAILQKENERLMNQVNQLQMQMINLVGNIHANPAIPTGIVSPDLLKGISNPEGK